MKKVFKLIALLSIIVLITGCVKLEYNMEIKNDKSVVIEVIYTIDKSAMEGLNSEEGSNSVSKNIDIENAKKLEEKGWKVEEYKTEEKEKTYEGIKISKTYPNIEEITKTEDKQVSLGDLLSEEKEFDDSQFFSKKNSNYKANFVFDLSSEESSEESDNETINMSAFTKMFDLNYSIKLPVAAKSTNANTISEDKKTLSWNLEYGKLNVINYEFELQKEEVSDISNKKSLPFYIVIGSVSLLLILIIAALIKKSKLNKNKLENQNVSDSNLEVAMQVEPTPEVAPVLEQVTSQVEPTPEVASVQEPVAPQVEPTPEVASVQEPVTPQVEPTPEVAPVLEPIVPQVEPAPEVAPVLEPVTPQIEPTPEVAPVPESVIPQVEPAPEVAPVLEPVTPQIEPTPEVAPVLEPVTPQVESTPEVIEDKKI